MNRPSTSAPHLALPAGAGLGGLKACVPVMIGYFPVAVTFGIAGLATGLSPMQVVLISALVYAGASQFLLLASIKAGTPWLWVVALCSLLNARHLLYGPLLARFLPERLRARLKIAFLLTDEVFATALNRIEHVAPAHRNRWMTLLGVGAWLTWIAGTAVGVYAGDGLERHFPMLSQVMRFALPALFLALVCQSASRALRWPIVAALAVGAAFAAAGHATLAILAGAVAGCVCHRPRSAP
ncbi:MULTISPECIES: AzlC family ABC transporter permease [Bordetella]|uniref:Azaleucine resistance protein AzlC n=2 Tax=Bordetella TaxID=517 RepID=A0A261VIY7_9BORD|nr:MULTISPECIES: AzlC family ABC transporter permease [Bordetella]MDM9559586.1 AzlC family ABC transporter permease [Bordetella petrii]OZI73570.1 azaleucine resistance protein AzlC [Bordetella genomosp. 2]